jgi:translation initiation factor IF-2
MAVNKSYRINKVAVELNVGYETLIAHLNENGHEVDVKPTAKINQDMYQLLLSNFQSEKAAKEESKAIKSSPKVKEEKISLAEKNTGFKETKKREEKEILIKNVGARKKKVEETEKEAKEEILEKKEGPGLKVLGKIDLPENKKAKKKEEEQTEKPIAKKEEPKKEKETPKPKEEPKVESPKKEEPKKEEPPKKEVKEEPAEEVIKAKMEKLGGLTIKGKIELPKEPVKKKKLVASTDTIDLKNKKKRKRKETSTGYKGNNKPVKKDKAEISEKEIQEKIRRTLSKIEGNKNKSLKSKFRKKRRDDHESIRQEQEERDAQDKNVLQVTEFLSANELASLMDKQVTEVITACFSLGMMVSINQRLDAETITIVADEFGYDVKFVDADAQIDTEEEIVDAPEDLEPRAPIVTIMGHVDHGKTSLLDYIRNENVIAGEAGGITQHIGAYEVSLKDGQKMTFIDTPGHEAFTAMRARGAQVTDLVIIVIAADDSVMPQTKEAISHAQAAGVPMVFAFNKMDKPGANSEKIREELSAMNILVEEWGGKFQAQEISAKKGQNIDKLLDKVLLEAELLELKANPDRLASGTVVEARMDKGRGIVTTVLVQSGTLEVGDHIVAGQYYGKVKALFNERNQRAENAGPASPVALLGFSGAPTAGDKFKVFEDEADAKDLANKRMQLIREQGIRTTKHITLDEIGRRLAVGNFKELKLIVKGDVDGSVEALADSLLKLTTEQVAVSVIHKGVGQISESDVMLASASDAIIIGFQVRPSAKAKTLAEEESIDIRHYSVIYKAIEEIKSAIEGMLEPDIVEHVIGNVNVREVFNITKVGKVAGCMVTDGKVKRDSKIRVIRDGVVIHDGALSALKRFKDDVKDVAKGFECGISIKNYNDIQVGDDLEIYEEEEIKRKLK